MQQYLTARPLFGVAVILFFVCAALGLGTARAEDCPSVVPPPGEPGVEFEDPTDLMTCTPVPMGIIPQYRCYVVDPKDPAKICCMCLHTGKVAHGCVPNNEGCTDDRAKRCRWGYKGQRP